MFRPGYRKPLARLMHIELDTSVTNVHAPTHQVPMAKLDQENEELKRLYEEGIIRPVTQPTDWPSNMQVKEKPNGKLCICIDPSWTINKTIKRPKYRYMILTSEEKLPLLTSHHCYCIWSISHHCTGWKVLSTQYVSGGQMDTIVTTACYSVLLLVWRKISGGNNMNS